MKAIICMIILACGCLCAKPMALEKNVTIEPSITTTLVTIIQKPVMQTTTSTILQTRTEIVTVYKISYINQSIDISDIQKKNLMNLMPESANSPAISAGFDQCKRQALDILGLKKTKFSERLTTKSDKEGRVENTCFRLEYSEISPFFDINADNFYQIRINESVTRVYRIK